MTQPCTSLLVTTGGNPLVRQEDLTAVALRNNQELVILNEDSTLLVLKRKMTKTRISVEETEEDADKVLNSDDSIIKAISEDSDEEAFRSQFDFDSEDILELVTEENHLTQLIDTLSSYSFSVDSTKFLKVVLEISKEYQLDYTLRLLMQLEEFEVRKLLRSKNVLSVFRKITDSYRDEEDDDSYTDSNEDYEEDYFGDDKEDEDDD